MTKVFSGLITRRLICVISLCCFFALPKVGVGQWKKIFTFPKAGVDCIYFMPYENIPKTGFAGLFNGNTMKTTDGGISWHDVNGELAPQNGINNMEALAIAFKDNFTGWLCTSIRVYTTNDGGENWSFFRPFSAPSVSCSPLDIYHNKKIGRIFVSGFPNSLVSLDETGNLVYQLTPTNLSSQGFAFINDSLGICTHILSGNSIQNLQYTTDGGLSWQLSPSTFKSNLDAWGPVGIEHSKTFFVLTTGYYLPGNNYLFKSTDGGINWENIYHYPGHDSGFATDATGYSLRTSFDSILFFQTSTAGSEGVMRSTDGGYHFVPICGPVGWPNTRFFVKDSFIYAADQQGNLWLNTTGIGSNSTPQISATSLSLKPVGCKPIDSIITFTFFDSCNGIQADLKTISLVGGGKFSLVSGGNARRLQENDSVGIRYDPQASGSDTAFLKLTFHLGFKDFDTTITFVGSGSSGAEQVGFSMGMPIKEFVGFTTGLSIWPTRTISGRGLASISFDLNYNGDLLGFRDCASSPGRVSTIGAEIVNGKMTTLPVTITGTDISLDSLSSLVDLSFHSYLSDTSSTAITMTNLKLNDGDPDYAQCVLSADTTSTSYSQILRCSEPTLQHYLQTKQVLFITSMRPNPTQGDIQLEVESGVKTDVSIAIYDVLGKMVLRQSKQLIKGNNGISFDTHELAKGTYTITIAPNLNTGSIISASFIKE